MNNTSPEILEKVAKLLRLAQSDNPHGAALAAGRAQELIDRHKLSADQVSLNGAIPSAEPIGEFGHDPLSTGRADRWKVDLAVHVARSNQCRVFLRSGAICLVGMPSDVSTVRYIYSWLTREVERIAARDCAGCGRTYWNNFRLGAVETLGRRLRAQKQETVAAVKSECGGNEHALMIVAQNESAIALKEQSVKDWMDQNMKLGKGRSSGSRFNPSARDAGRRAGGEVKFSAASGALGGGRAALR